MITQMLLRALDKKAIWLVGILLVVAVAVPLSNLLLSPGQFGHVPGYMVTLLGKYLCYAMLALALDLVWGYCGILSLGHGAFFAIGGYAMGMYLMRQIGDRGVYANPVLPDFMVFLNWKELPWYWLSFDIFPYAMLMVILIPGLLAFVFGWLAFRSRVTGVYLSIITQAMTFALLLAFFRNDFGFGGNNGMTDFKDILGFPIQAASTRAVLFAVTAVMLALSVYICAMIVNSKLGKVMVAVRDAESRTRFIGYRVEHVKLFAFVVSAVMAGIAGALYVPQVGIINPSEFEPANSIEAVIWVAVGGRGTLIGPIVGALAVNAGKTVFTSGGAYLGAMIFVLGFSVLVALAGGWRKGLIVLSPVIVGLAYGIVRVVMAGGVPAVASELAGGNPLVIAGVWFSAITSYLPSLANIWLFALGGLFVIVTLYLPGGIVGTIADLFLKRRRPTGKANSAAAESGKDPDTMPPNAAPEPAE